MITVRCRITMGISGGRLCVVLHNTSNAPRKHDHDESAPVKGSSWIANCCRVIMSLLVAIGMISIDGSFSVNRSFWFNVRAWK